MRVQLHYAEKTFPENKWYYLATHYVFIMLPAALGAWSTHIDAAKSPVEAVSFWVVVVLFLFVGFPYVVLKKRSMQGKSNESVIDKINHHLGDVNELLLDLRTALLSTRRLAHKVIYGLEDLPSTREALRALRKFAPASLTYASIMQEILEETFQLVAKGNRNLNIHVTVGFLAPRDDSRLHVLAYANSDRTPSMNMDGFAENEGCAGRCWAQNEIIIVPNTDRDEKHGFAATSHRHHQIKSIACLPVSFVNKNDNSREFIGVLSLDADMPEYFRDSAFCRESLRTELEPYFALIRGAYRFHSLCSEQDLAEHPAGASHA